MKKCILLTLTFFNVIVSVSSQTQDDVINGSIYENQIKLIDEFFYRFNDDTIANSKIDNDSVEYLRSKLKLFDLKQFKSDSDSVFFCAVNFIDSIKKNQIKLVYSDSLWFADVSANVKLNNKNKKCSLHLRYVPRGNDMYKWIICTVDFGDFILNPNVPDLFIKPIAHEMDFMELKEDVNEYAAYINSFFPDSFRCDDLSIFAFLVRNGYLKIETISMVKFVFEQVPGYRFFVSYFPRETQNSGWLIEKIERK